MAQHGKIHFGAIYALALLSVLAMYVLLNLMTDGIDVYRVASVLGCVLASAYKLWTDSIVFECGPLHTSRRYSLLPMVGLAFVTIVVPTK